MKKRIKRIIHPRYILPALIILAFIFSTFAIKLYLARVDVAAKEIQNKTKFTYVTKDNEINSSGFYVANLKDELTEYIGNGDLSEVTYRFDGENFYIEVKAIKDEEGNMSFEIEKIACPEFSINARMNMKNIESIEYRTGNPKKSTVLKINQTYNSDYFAMTDGTYYFLGSDIESISFKDEHFYYMSYNKNYLSLEKVTSCSKEVKADIDGFNGKDYYYKYGRINFLADYYQKLASKTFTVQDRCDELAGAQDAE